MIVSRSVLITGGAGFIGSHLADRLLTEGCRVTSIDNFDPYYPAAQKRANIRGQLDHPGYTFAEVDIRDRAALERDVEGSFDAIVHLAARPGVRTSLDDPLASVSINVDGTANLLEMARERSIPHFVFGSSSSVYGVNPSVPWREDDKVLLPISPYAASKVSGEMLGHVYSSLFDIRVVALRFFTVYGPRQRPDLAMHKFALKMLAGEPIPMFGDGSTRRDYTFVQDIIDGVTAALDFDAEKYVVMNLGSGRTISLAEMISTLEDVLGVPAIIDRQTEQPGDVPQTWADISSAAERLGYAPGTPLRDGLVAFRDWLLSEERRD